MAPNYKLTYFDGKGLAEPIRFLFAYGGIEYIDDMFTHEQWPSIKLTMPWGMAPILEVDGKIVHQSVTICRYLAKKIQLAGADDWEAMQIDAIVDTITDFRLKIGDYFYEKDDIIKEKKKQVLFKETLPYYLQKFEDLVKTNGGYLVNGKLTWADLYYVAVLDYMNYMVDEDLFAKYPSLCKMRENVLEIAAIKEWVAKRPYSTH